MIIITVVSSTCKLVSGLVVNIAAETLCQNSYSLLVSITVLAQGCRTDAVKSLLVHAVKYRENVNILNINLDF